MEAPNSNSFQYLKIRPDIGIYSTIIFKPASKAYYVNDFNWEKNFQSVHKVKEYHKMHGAWSKVYGIK